jgi:hypothetical protein
MALRVERAAQPGAVKPEREAPGPAEGAGSDDAERAPAPHNDAGRERQQRAEVGGEEEEAAAARPRHHESNGRTRRLEPDTQRLGHPAERE